MNPLNYITEYVISFSEIFAFYLFLKYLLNTRPEYSKLKIGIFLVFISLLIFIITLFQLPLYLKMPLTFLLYLAFATVYSSSKTNKLFLILVFYLIIILAEVFFISLLFVLNIQPSEVMHLDGNSRYISAFIIKSIEFAVIYVVAKILKPNQIILPRKYTVLIWAIFILTISTMIFLLRQALYFHRNFYSTSFLFIVCLVFIIINIVVFYYYLRSNQFYLKNKEQEIKNIYLKANQKYVNEGENQSEYLHKIWHDLNNHVKNLELLVDNHSSGDALNYLQSIKKNIDKIPNKIVTGNRIVDVVLNRKNADIIVNDIKFNVKAAIAPQLDIEETDLSAILFNSIDNAIEASLYIQNKEDRLIEIELYHKKKYVYYQIRNNVNSLSSKNPKGTYNKKKYIPTGYGLVILKDIADKYNGNFEYGVQEGKFILTIYLLV